MSRILEFFEPTLGLNIWIGKIILLFAGSYLIIWLLAIFLCRVGWFVKENDAQLRVYFGWMIPFTIHAIFSAVLLLSTAFSYKQLGTSPGYCLPYLVLLFVSSGCGLSLSGKISQRLRKLGKRLRI